MHADKRKVVPTEVIYLDSLIVTELACDFMLLLATDRLCAAAAGWKRLLAGAAFGSAYSVFYAFYPNVGGRVMMKLLCAAIMLLISFGAGKKYLRFAAVFIMSAASFAGIVLAVSLVCGGFGSKQLFFSFCAAYALLGGIMRFSAAKRGTVKAVIKNRGKSVMLFALRDSGSSLRDPVSGAPTLIACEKRLLPLFSDSVRDILNTTQKLSAPERLERLWQSGEGMRFKLLPYSAVGVEGGMLLAFRPERAEIEGREVRGMLAVLAPDEVSEDGTYSAIVNGDV